MANGTGNYSGLEAPGLVSSKTVGPSGSTENYNKNTGWAVDPHTAGSGAVRTAYSWNNPTYQSYLDEYAGSGNVAGTNYGTGGRGGSGGGAPAYKMSQEAFDAMLASLPKRPGKYQFQEFEGTPYQGMDIEPWNDTRYRMMEQAMGDAYTQAEGRIGTGYQNVRDNLGTNWDTYNQMRAAQQMTQGPQMPAQVSTLGQNQAAVSEANANMGASDRAFQNYLAANDLRANAGQASRLTEADYAQQFALDQLASGKIQNQLGLGLAEQRGWEDWQRRQNDRRYQDSQIGQQWGREDDQMNWKGGNEAGLLNWNTGNEFDKDQASQYLELIALADQYGLDFSALM